MHNQLLLHAVRRILMTGLYALGVLSGGLSAAYAQATVDLTITKDVSPKNANPGDLVTFTLQVGNLGPGDGQGARILDVMPTGMTGVTASCGGAVNGAVCPTLAVSDALVNGVVPKLPKDGQLVVTIAGHLPQIPGGTSITNTATITPAVGVTDADPSTNSSTVSVGINLDIDLSTTVIPSPSTVVFGAPVRFQITYTNNSNVPVADVFAASKYFSSNPFLQGQPTGAFTRISCTQGANTNACLDSVFPLAGALDESASNGIFFEGVIPKMGPKESVTVEYEAVWRQGNGCTTYTDPSEVYFQSSVVPFPYNGAPPYNETDYSNNQTTVTLDAPSAPPCVTVMNRVEKTALSPAGNDFVSGTTYEFQLVFANDDQTHDFNGATIEDSAMLAGFLAQGGGSYAYFDLQCQTNDPAKAVCPALPSSGSGTLIPVADSGTSASIFKTQVPTWLPGGVLTITYKLTVNATLPSCALSTSGSFYNLASMRLAQSNQLMVDSGNKRVLYDAPPMPLCEAYDLTAKHAVDKSMLVAGKSNTFTVTYTNAGPANANNVLLSEDLMVLNYLGGHVKYSTTKPICTAAGGATCPLAGSFQSVNGGSVPVDNSVSIWKDLPATIPVGGTVTVSYSLTLSSLEPLPAICSAQAANLQIVTARGFSMRDSAAQPPLIESDLYNNGAESSLNFNCTDLVVDKTIDRVTASAGDPVTYTILVTNAGAGVAKSPVISDPLPSGFVFSGAAADMQCVGAACVAPVWTAATRTVTVSPAEILPGESVVITLTGKAGSKGTYANTATVRSDEYTDIKPDSDRSQVNLLVDGGDTTATGGAKPVPSLNEWAVMLLGLAMLGLVGGQLRRARR